MPAPKTILVAVDFTPTSERALEVALDWAVDLKATVLLVHSYELPIYSAPDAALTVTPELASELATNAQTGLNRLVERYASTGVALTTELRAGSAVEEINAAADAHNVDLIVLGTHGRGGLARILLGSSAESILRAANRPVLVVRTGDDAPASRPVPVVPEST